MDEILFKLLNDASVDEPGIDWDAFSKKSKRKKILVWFYLSTGFVILTLLVYLISGMYLKTNPQQSKEELALGQNELPLPKKTEKPAIAQGEPKTMNQRFKTKETANTYTAHRLMKRNNTFKVTDLTFQPTLDNTPVLHDIEPDLTFDILPVNLQGKMINDFQFQALPVEQFQLAVLKPVVLKNKIQGGLYWEIQAGPSLNIPNFKVTNSGKQFIHKQYEGIRKHSESAESGYTLQLGFGKSIKRLCIGVGVGYSYFTLRGDYNYNYSEKPVIDVDGSINGYLPAVATNISFSTKQKLSFIEVPLNLQYTLMQLPKLNLDLRLGYVNQFLTNIEGQLPNPVFLDEREAMSSENYKTRTSSLQTGLQLSYKLDKKTSIILMPEYRYGIGFKQIQSLYKTNFSFWGLNLTYRKAL